MTTFRKLLALSMVLVLSAFVVWAGGQAEEGGGGEAAAEEEEMMEGFDWRRYEGDEIHFLANNNPVGQLIDQYADEFTELTGIEVTVSLFSEQQYRQRRQTIFQAESDEVDVFMTLVSRQGMLFERAGWYEPLMPFVNNTNVTSPDYDFDDFGAGVIDSKTVNGTLTGIPVNIEGPILYWRTDVFEECGLDAPSSLEGLEDLAMELQECRPDLIPWASRGLAPAVPYTFSNFLHNFGGEYQDADGMSNLSSSEGVAAIELYARLMREYGPDGGINFSFPQLTAVNTNGQAGMVFESSNEFSKVMETEARLDDTDVMVLPPGPAGSTPVVIGWSLAMSPFSSKQNQAWYFIQWATSKDMQVKLALDGLAPPRDSVWDSDEFQDWLAEADVRRQWADSLSGLAADGSSVLAPQIVLQPEARQIIGEEVGAVILGEKTAEEAAQSADQQINRLIERGEQ
jgi:multiple sugar transport system substrate-binding protein